MGHGISGMTSSKATVKGARAISSSTTAGASLAFAKSGNAEIGNSTGPAPHFMEELQKIDDERRRASKMKQRATPKPLEEGDSFNEGKF